MNTFAKKSFRLLLFILILTFNVGSIIPAGAWNSIVRVPLSLPSGYNAGYLRDIWGSGASDIYIVGIGDIGAYQDRPLLYHKQGTTWSAVNLSIPSGSMEVGLWSVWGSGASHVYAAGYHYDANDDSFPLLYHTVDGTHWTGSSLSLPAGRIEGELNKIWGLSASNIYAVGSARNVNNYARPLLYHNTGAGWTPFSPPLPDYWDMGWLMDIWGSSSNNLYAVGNGFFANGNRLPLLYRNTGGGWTETSFSLPGEFSEGGLDIVWGTSANDVYIGGFGRSSTGDYRPFISHTNNGIDWTHTVLPLPAGLVGGGISDMWGSSASDVYLVGVGIDENYRERPVMYHNDGTGWTKRMIDLPAEFSEGSLFGVWGSSANNMYMAGSGNYDGQREKPLLYQRTQSITPPTMTPFQSGGAQDGWVLESTETSNRGGTLNALAATFILGDTANRRQYRSILHFNTSSLPDNAVITRVVLKIKKQSLTGTDPFTTHGKITVDIRKGVFSNNAALQVTDFQAAGNKLAAGLFANNPQAGDWYTSTLEAAAYPYISRIGITQFRLRFQTDDDNDAVADFFRFYSGNATAANRPVLVIEYYVP